MRDVVRVAGLPGSRTTRRDVRGYSSSRTRIPPHHVRVAGLPAATCTAVVDYPPQRVRLPELPGHGYRRDTRRYGAARPDHSRDVVRLPELPGSRTTRRDTRRYGAARPDHSRDVVRLPELPGSTDYPPQRAPLRRYPDTNTAAQCPATRTTRRDVHRRSRLPAAPCPGSRTTG